MLAEAIFKIAVVRVRALGHRGAFPGRLHSTFSRSGLLFFGIAMLYCTPEKCAVCQLIPGSDFCFRRQARRCLAMSRQVVSRGVRHALEDLHLQLLEKACSVEYGQATRIPD